MKIGIDTTVTQLGTGGMAVYVRELVPELQGLLGEDQCLPFRYSLRLGRSNRIAAKLETAYRDILWSNLVTPVKLSRMGVDLLHAPHIRTTLRSPVPTVVTVCDCWGPRNPQGFSRWAGVFARAVPTLYTRASALVAISEFTKTELEHFCPKVDPAKIVVTPLGVSSRYRPASAEACAAIREKHDLPERYLLAVNTLEPRKNLLNLIQAFERASGEIDEDLVLIGSRGWIPDHLRDVLLAIDRNPRVHYLGYVPDEDLPPLYTAATAYVFPSLYEGFGLPAIEAMACGCPVAASRGSSLDEVIAGAGLQFDPLDVEDMAGDLVRMCGEDSLRTELTAKGIENARRFTWRKTAEKTVEAYQLALNA